MEAMVNIVVHIVEKGRLLGTVAKFAFANGLLAKFQSHNEFDQCVFLTTSIQKDSDRNCGKWTFSWGWLPF